MAIGATDTKIQLWTRAVNAPEFTFSTSLPGHADWVRCLAFSAPLLESVSSVENIDYKESDILLASGSQDNYIRLWRFTTNRANPASTSKSVLDILDDLDETADGEIAAKQYTITVQGEDTLFACNSESVLLGHDAWVTGLHWQNRSTSIPALLSASADRSMILWKQDEASSLWLTSQRFGELGGTNLGFFGALWGKDDRTVLAHGWGGSFHAWRQEENSEIWRSTVSISGHFDEVTSLAWEPKGEYLVSVSADQTARLHACWSREDGTKTWHELARPQIHGYDMEDVDLLSRLRFISGSEEKIVRVFDAPGTFLSSMRSLGVTRTLEDDVRFPCPLPVVHG